MEGGRHKRGFLKIIGAQQAKKTKTKKKRVSLRGERSYIQTGGPPCEHAPESEWGGSSNRKRKAEFTVGARREQRNSLGGEGCPDRISFGGEKVVGERKQTAKKSQQNM